MTKPVPRLLLVDDDVQLAAMLLEYLELQGLHADVVTDGETALKKIAESEPELIILDVMLPGISGFDVLKKIRETRDLPVIMLTARGEEPDRILGLMHGADDYLPKPFNPLELAARIKAVLKRSRPAERDTQESLRVGPLELNIAKRELTASNQLLSVTAAEMNVLEQLMRHPDEVLSRARLTELALERPLEAYDRSIDTLISKLRNKLAAANISRDCIRALRGHGYVLDSENMGEH
jgi:DNA-binding response OmpR family regulator